MRKKYLKLTQDQKKQGVIFSSELKGGGDSIIHEVQANDEDMDKKIELERIKASKGAPKKDTKKKTVAEEAKDLGLVYIGNGRYADRSGTVTHLNENGILLPYLNKD